jgi:hypothetical protein
MQSRATLLVAGLGLVGVGFSLGRILPREPESEGEVADAVVREERPTEAPVLVGRPEGPAEVATPAAVLDRLREAAQDIPLPSLPEGSGVIEGKIRTEAGEAVPGVEVTLTPDFPETLGDGPASAGTDPAEYLPRYLAHQAARMRWAVEAKRTTRTGSDGAFRFDGLADLWHQVVPRLDGWRFRRVVPAPPGLPQGLRPGEPVDYLAWQVAEVEFDVRLPDGSPADNWRVDLRTESGSSGFSGSTRQQTHEMKPGRYDATARGGPDRRFGSNPVSVDLEAGRRTTLRIDLVARSAILARVRYPPGEESEWTTVTLARVPGGVPLEPLHLASPLATKSSRGEEALLFDGLTPGRYGLGVQRISGGPLAVIREVEVGAGPVEIDLVVPPLRRGEYITLRALGPDGAALANPSISIGYFDESNATTHGGAPKLRRPDGSLRVFHGIVTAPSRSGRRWVRVAATGLGEQVVEYGAAEAPDLTVRFAAPVAQEVVVLGIQPEYEGRLRIALDGSPAGMRGRADGGPGLPVEADGRAKVDRIQPGAYECMVSVLVGGHSVPVLRREVVVSDAPAPITLTLPTLHAVTFVGVEVGHVHVMSGDRSRGHWMVAVRVTDGDRAAVDGLPEGDYEATSGSKRVRFRVPGAAEVRF